MGVRRYLRWSILGVFGLLLVIPVSRSASAQAARTYNVEIGQILEGIAAESNAFYPSSLRIRSGEVVRFTNEFGSIPETGIHAALALPPDVDPAEWEPENTLNLDGEWGFFQTDPDEDPGPYPTAVKGNWKTILPTDLSCGTVDNPCITGTSPAARSPINSGVNDPLDFSLKIEAESGTRIWVICAIHTKMKMKIDVVAEEEPTSTIEEIEAANETKLLRETAKAQRLHRIYSARRTSKLRADGSRVWDAWPGIERGTLFLIDMYPKKLSVARGDSIKWHFEDTKTEIHSVTFPLVEALEVHNAPWIGLTCDLDTDEGPAEDLEPPAGAPCPSPPSDVWEFDIDSRFYFPHGNGAMRGGNYESSGMRGALAGMSQEPFVMRFPQSSGLTVFDFACQLHPTMRGAVKVR